MALKFENIENLTNSDTWEYGRFSFTLDRPDFPGVYSMYSDLRGFFEQGKNTASF